MARLQHRYGMIDLDYSTFLATRPEGEDGPVWMLNFMKYHEVAQYENGEQISGREADDRYAPTEVLADLGATVALFGNVSAASEDWDRMAVVCYPTRRSFIDMQSRPDFAAKHEHKAAGMHHTTIAALQPRGELPVSDRGRLLVEIWDGDEPAPVSERPGTYFDVEGTIIGDERHWQGVRLTPLGPDDVVDLSVGTPQHLLVDMYATISSWS
jgi:hypothetical protein